MTGNPGDLELRPGEFLKIIRTKHEKYLMFIFNLKVKILIKTISLSKKNKKNPQDNTCFLSKQMKSPIGIGNKRVKTEKNKLKETK